LSWFNGVYKRKKEAFAFFEKNRAEGQSRLKAIYEEEKTKITELLSR
jgi:hypothetical protein